MHNTGGLSMQQVQVVNENVAAQPQQSGSGQSSIANIVATVVAIAGAVVASPSAMERLPNAVETVLKTTATLGNTAQPLLVTVIAVVVAGMTHPPAWFIGLAHGMRRRL